MEHESDGDINCGLFTWDNSLGIGKMTGRLRNKRKNVSRLHHCGDWLEYWEESSKLEETCCPSNSSERPSAKAGVKIF